MFLTWFHSENSEEAKWHQCQMSTESLMPAISHTHTQVLFCLTLKMFKYAQNESKGLSERVKEIDLERGKERVSSHSVLSAQCSAPPL